MLLFKFLVTGSINTLFYYLLYALLIYLGLSYTAAVIIATFITMLFSFKTFGKYVFKKSDNTLIIKFALLTLFNLLLNIIIIYLLKKAGLNDYTAGLLASLLVAINSFFINKIFIFK